MKIAILSDTIMPTPTPDGHGLGRAAYNAATQLIKRGHRVMLFGLIGSKLPGGQVVMTPINSLAGENVLADEIVKNRNIFDVALDIGHRHALAKQNALPTVAWFQDIYSATASNAVFVSEFCRGAVGIDGPIVRNAVDPDAYPLYDGEREKWALFIGHNHPHKGLAIAQQVAKDAGRHLRAYGSGCPDGLVSGALKIKVLQMAAVVLCPYHSDAGAHVPLEAMMCGTPVIALDKGCMSEYVPTGGGVACLTPEEMSELAQSVPGYARAKQVHKAVIDAGFTIERLGAEIENVLKRVVNGDRW